MSKLLLLLPEIAVSVMMTMILIGLILKNDKPCNKQNMVLTVLSLLASGSAVYTFGRAGSLFVETYQVDLLSQVFKMSLAACLALFFYWMRQSDAIAVQRRPESYLFATTAVLGMMMMTSAVNLLTFYIALELSSYSLYLLSAMRKDKMVSEASVKYLLFGAAISGIMLWGFSLLAGVSGSTSLAVIAQNAAQHWTQPAFILGFIFVLFSLLFKLSAAPFHFWAPDVYQASALPVTGLIATASKAAGVALLIRIMMFLGLTANVVAAIGVLAFLSMTLGNTVALVQSDVKRLLAYSSIAQAGYLLVGLLSDSFNGYASSVFYAIAYLVMNGAAFFVVILVAKAIREENPSIAHFDGLAEKSPFLSLILLLSLLSLAGIPPLVGFTGKWILFSAAMNKGHWFLVLWGVLNSVVSLFYYLTLVKHAYLEKPKDRSAVSLSWPAKGVGLLFFAGMIVLGVYPNPLISLCQKAIESTLLF